jgi:hypothetical protein
MSENRIPIRLLRIYFPRISEFGSASEFRGGGLNPPNPPRYATGALTVGRDVGRQPLAYLSEQVLNVSMNDGVTFAQSVEKGVYVRVCACVRVCVCVDRRLVPGRICSVTHAYESRTKSYIFMTYHWLSKPDEVSCFDSSDSSTLLWMQLPRVLLCSI